ncbi:MAG: hypothetical protein ABL867_07635 [Rickettsiales bacterium]
MSYFKSQTAPSFVYAGLLATLYTQNNIPNNDFNKIIVKPSIVQSSPTSSNSIFLNPFNVLKNTVLDYFETKTTHGWDGYEAVPITEISKNIALKIVSFLPKKIKSPRIVPSTSGGYSIEWFAEQKVLSIEIEDREISWSFVDALNKRKQSGYEKTFSEKFPSTISDLLVKEFSA